MSAETSAPPASRNGNTFFGAECCQLLLDTSIQHTTTGDHQRFARLAYQGNRLFELEFIGQRATDAMNTFCKEALGVIESLCLYVLTQRERDRTTFCRIGQHGHRAVESGHDLLGPGDPVEIARDRAKRVARAHRAIAEILHLLQDRVWNAISKHITWQKQNRQTVDMRHRRTRHHIQGARPDGAGAGHGPATARGLGESRRRVNHALLVMTAQGGQCLPLGMQRLTQTGNIAMAENRPDTGKEGSMRPSISVFCAIMARTRAWLMVKRIVFIPLLPGFRRWRRKARPDRETSRPRQRR